MSKPDIEERLLEELIKVRHALDCLAETLEKACAHYTGYFDHVHRQNAPDDEPEDTTSPGVGPG